MDILRSGQFYKAEQISPSSPQNNASTVEPSSPNPCCVDYSCPNPCYPVVYPMSMPIVLPARTVFEPVIHDHPPLHVIKKIIKGDKKKWHKHSSSEGCSSSDTDTDSDSDIDTDTSSSDSSTD